MALMRYLKVSPKKIIELSHEDYENQEFNRKLMEADEEYAKSYTPKGATIQKHPIKKLIKTIKRYVWR
jgi:hypothetical protein